MSDIDLHDNSPHQDWQGGAPIGEYIEQKYLYPAPTYTDLHRDEPVSFTQAQLEHVFEHARALLHKEGMDWAEACRLAERIRARVMGKA